MIVTAADLEVLMYGLPHLVAASRRRRGLTMHGAAAQIGVAASTITRIEQGHSCDVRVLIRVLAWLEPT